MPAKITLPPAVELAAMVRASTLDQVAEDHGCAPITIYRAIHDAGFSQSGHEARQIATSFPRIDADFDDQPWAVDALCLQVDPELFFPEKGGSTKEAKGVCLSCDVREQCLQWALDTDQRFGLWGGLSERERRKLKRQALASTGTDGPTYDAVDQAVDELAEQRPVVSRGGSGTNATGHRPIPLATAVAVRSTHTPKAPRPTGLDWSKHTAPDTAPAPVPAPGKTRCRWCREPSTDVVDDLCPTCRAEAEQQFTVPTPQPAPSPAPAPQEVPAMLDEPTDHQDDVVELPPYALDIAILMRDTEGHPDPAVRACRKTVVAALQGLHRIYTPTPAASTPPAPVAVPTSTPATATGPTRSKSIGRPRGSSTDGTKIKALYVDEHMSVPQIAKALHHGNATIRRALKQAGVQMRDDRATNSGGRNAKTIDDYNPRLVTEITRLYVDEQHTTVEVAQKVGHTPKLVTTILERAGIPRRPSAATPGRKGKDQRLDDAKRDDICRRYQAGESSVTLSTAYDVSTTTILGLLRSRDIPVRGAAEARRNALAHREESGS